VQLGLIAWRAKDNAKAIGHYKDALVINPNIPTGATIIGMVYASQQKNKEALECFLKASRVNPGYADAWSDAGLMHHVLNQKNEAAAAYKKAISLNNADARAMRNLSMILKEQGNPDAALWAQRASAIDGK
jgi:tetratricopeptide (TPR) repeat protein